MRYLWVGIRYHTFLMCWHVEDFFYIHLTTLRLMEITVPSEFEFKSFTLKIFPQNLTLNLKHHHNFSKKQKKKKKPQCCEIVSIGNLDLKNNETSEIQKWMCNQGETQDPCRNLFNLTNQRPHHWSCDTTTAATSWKPLWEVKIWCSLARWQTYSFLTTTCLGDFHEIWLENPGNCCFSKLPLLVLILLPLTAMSLVRSFIIVYPVCLFYSLILFNGNWRSKQDYSPEILLMHKWHKYYRLNFELF